MKLEKTHFELILCRFDRNLQDKIFFKKYDCVTFKVRRNTNFMQINEKIHWNCSKEKLGTNGKSDKQTD